MSRRLAAVLALWCLAVALAAPAAAQPAPGTPPPFRDERAIPDTPAYRRAREVLELVNAGDPERIRGYVSGTFTDAFRGVAPMDEHVRILTQAHENSDRYVEHSARHYTPPRPETQAVLVVWNTLFESWEAIVLEVEPAPPHRIASLELNPARVPSDLPPAEPLADREIARRVSAAVERLAERRLFSGACLLAHDGKVLLAKAAGIANRDFNVPVRLDTKFNLGSMNKMFTGVAVMQLVEQGKLSLEDPLSRWLSEDWLPREILDRVRVEHLLTHTSGLGSYFNDAFDLSSRELYRRVEDYQRLVRGDTLRFEPGTRWSYSNTGMLLAGAVIEKASGEDYFDYVRRHVYEPAGMTSTDCYALDQVNPNLAVGYERRMEGGQVVYENNLFKHVLRGGPAGGGYSTVEDLLRFERALRDGRLVRPATLERLWRAHPELGSPDYGLGFGVESTPRGKLVGHSGGFFGISSDLQILVDAGYTIVVLTNQGGSALPVSSLARTLILQGH